MSIARKIARNAAKLRAAQQGVSHRAHASASKHNLREQMRAKQNVERLLMAAIVRDGITHSNEQSHGAIRSRMGDPDPYEEKRRPADTEGFLTSERRFVTRAEAVQIGIGAGQLSPDWAHVGRKLLSSDIDW